MMRKETVVLGWLPQPMGGMQLLQQSFFDSVFNFISNDAAHRQVFAGYTYNGTGYIAQGRDAMCRQFLDQSKGDWLLMIDWDITFVPDDVYKLLDFADGDWTKIVAGCYVTWFGDDGALRPCWMDKGPDGTMIPVTAYDSSKVVELGMAGMGFTLIHRKALERMSEAGNDDPWEWFGHDVIGGTHTGEDVTFCHRAAKVGLTVWGHGGVQLGHNKFKTVTPADIFNSALAFARASVDKAVLNVGGGSKAGLPDRYAGWRHVLLDIEDGPDVDLVMDARDLSPEMGAFDGIYCSHTLEHFTEIDTPDVLKRLAAVVRPGGTIEIHVPDGDEVDRLTAEVGLHGVAYDSPAGPITPYDMIHGHQASIAAGNVHMAHHQVFTAESLRAALENAGLVDVEIAAHDFELEAMAKVN